MFKMTLKEIEDKGLNKDQDFVKDVMKAYSIFDKYGSIGKTEEQLKERDNNFLELMNKEITELMQQGVDRLAIQHALILDLKDHHQGDNKRALYGMCDPYDIPCVLPSNEHYIMMDYRTCNNRQFITGCEFCLNPVCTTYGFGLCPNLTCPTDFVLYFPWCNCSLGLGCQKNFTCQYFRPELGYEYGHCTYNLPDGEPIPYDFELYPVDEYICPDFQENFN
jgi:hypothetical protein